MEDVLSSSVETTKVVAFVEADVARLSWSNSSDSSDCSEIFPIDGVSVQDTPSSQSSDSDSDSEGSTVTSCAGRNKVSADDFDFLAYVGCGGFGKVFQVQKKDVPSEIYAMKIMRKDSIIKRNQVKYIRSERDTLIKASEHPFIAQLFYAFQSAHKLYLVMRFCSGGELFFHLRKEAMLSEISARFYAAEIVSALGHMHSLDIVHRDLKPENVLLTGDGHICITDFGLAKEDVRDFNSGTTSFCGTDEYMAPEIIAGKPYGKAVDWWSLGCLIFEMLTGKPPFEMKGNNKKELHKRILEGKMKFPPYLSPEATNLMKGLLNRDPTKRLGSGPKGVEEIQKHQFFKGLSWQKLLAKQITPPYVPSQEQQSTLANFSENFTKKAAHDSIVEPTGLPAPTNPEPFLNFSYVAPSFFNAVISGR